MHGGNFTHLQIGNGAIITDKNVIAKSLLLIERGYTSYEHFAEVGIIHMNGRLYDPLLRRFLNADENIQDPYNTQNYNKYGYVMNNPLMFNDPSGEASIPVIIANILRNSLFYQGFAVLTGQGNVKMFLLNSYIALLTYGASTIVSSAMSCISSSFLGVVAQSSVNGAISGGINAVFNGENFLKGVYRGAVMGAAMGGISYGISNVIMMLTTPHYSYHNITEDDLKFLESDNSSSVDASPRTMWKTFYDKGWNEDGTGARNFYADNPTKRYIRDGDWYYDTVDKVRAGGYTRFNNWNNTTSINLAKTAFASKLRLEYVMTHELAHSTIFMNPSLRSFLQVKVQKNGKEVYEQKCYYIMGLRQTSVLNMVQYGV